MPARIRLLCENPPAEEDRKITRNKVAKAPAKANSGTDTSDAAVRFSSNATAAPKAAAARP